MAATNFELKEYQSTALGRFRAYLRDVNNIGPDGANLAFYKATNMPYRHAPVIAEGTPYVCLRIPTGGGKTVIRIDAPRSFQTRSLFDPITSNS